ncbi:hypothetical protein [Methylobacterium sp. WL8]|uniref:hypothetical protein n=1 Tax=Methylobacterium sp. WL8 TaxID=2603899 RepID=UPI0011C89489|nr:hypothetical protein [Methylobacterium sp. WL8]TXN81508.1 hypothetical protein FV234_13320 [Methylobacterium sp. WL8]
MRALLILASLALALIYYQSQDAGSDPSPDAAVQPEHSEREKQREEAIARRRSEAKLAAERSKVAVPIIEAALTELTAKGVTRADLKAHFYEEIEEEVCDARECRED